VVADQHDLGSAERWVVYPLGSVFDLIQSEYGWSDDQILDLTLPRLRMVVEVIDSRLREERRTDLMKLELQTKAILAGLGVAAQSKGQLSYLRKLISKLSFVPDREEELPSMEAVEAMFSARR